MDLSERNEETACDLSLAYEHNGQVDAQNNISPSMQDSNYNMDYESSAPAGAVNSEELLLSVNSNNAGDETGEGNPGEFTLRLNSDDALYALPDDIDLDTLPFVPGEHVLIYDDLDKKFLLCRNGIPPPFDISLYTMNVEEPPPKPDSSPTLVPQEEQIPSEASPTEPGNDENLRADSPDLQTADPVSTEPSVTNTVSVIHTTSSASYRRSSSDSDSPKRSQTLKFDSPTDSLDQSPTDNSKVGFGYPDYNNLDPNKPLESDTTIEPNDQSYLSESLQNKSQSPFGSVDLSPDRIAIPEFGNALSNSENSHLSEGLLGKSHGEHPILSPDKSTFAMPYETENSLLSESMQNKIESSLKTGLSSSHKKDAQVAHDMSLENRPQRDGFSHLDVKKCSELSPESKSSGDIPLNLSDDKSDHKLLTFSNRNQCSLEKDQSKHRDANEMKSKAEERLDEKCTIGQSDKHGKHDWYVTESDSKKLIIVEDSSKESDSSSFSDGKVRKGLVMDDSQLNLDIDESTRLSVVENSITKKDNLPATQNMFTSFGVKSPSVENESPVDEALEKDIQAESDTISPGFDAEHTGSSPLFGSPDKFKESSEEQLSSSPEINEQISSGSPPQFESPEKIKDDSDPNKVKGKRILLKNKTISLPEEDNKPDSRADNTPDVYMFDDNFNDNSDQDAVNIRFSPAKKPDATNKQVEMKTKKITSPSKTSDDSEASQKKYSTRSRQRESSDKILVSLTKDDSLEENEKSITEDSELGSGVKSKNLISYDCRKRKKILPEAEDSTCLASDKEFGIGSKLEEKEQETMSLRTRRKQQFSSSESSKSSGEEGDLTTRTEHDEISKATPKSSSSYSTRKKRKRVDEMPAPSDNLQDNGIEVIDAEDSGLVSNVVQKTTVTYGTRRKQKLAVESSENLSGADSGVSGSVSNALQKTPVTYSTRRKQKISGESSESLQDTGEKLDEEKSTVERSLESEIEDGSELVSNVKHRVSVTYGSRKKQKVPPAGTSKSFDQLTDNDVQDDIISNVSEKVTKTYGSRRKQRSSSDKIEKQSTELFKDLESSPVFSTNLSSPLSPKQIAQNESMNSDDNDLISNVKSRVSTTYGRTSVSKRKPESVNLSDSKKQKRSPGIQKVDITNADQDEEIVDLAETKSQNESLQQPSVVPTVNSKKESSVISKYRKREVPKRFSPAASKHKKAPKITSAKVWNQLIKSCSAAKRREFSAATEQRKIKNKVKKQYMTLAQNADISPKSNNSRDCSFEISPGKDIKKAKIWNLCKDKKIKDPLPSTIWPTELPFNCLKCNFGSSIANNLLVHMQHCTGRGSSINYQLNDMDRRQSIRGKDSDEQSRAYKYTNGNAVDAIGDNLHLHSSIRCMTGEVADDDESEQVRDRLGYAEKDIVWAKVTNRFWPSVLQKLNKNSAFVYPILCPYSITSSKVQLSNVRSFNDTKFNKRLINAANKLEHADKFITAVQMTNRFFTKRAVDECCIDTEEYFKVPKISPNCVVDDETSSSNYSVSDSSPEQSMVLDSEKETKKDKENKLVAEIMEYISAGKCDDYVLSIHKEKTPSKRHNMFSSNDSAVKDKLKDMSWFGPFKSDPDLQIQLYDHFHDVYAEKIGLQSDATSYIYEVMIPEAIIKAISVTNNTTMSRAEVLFYKQEMQHLTVTAESSTSSSGDD